MSNLPDGDTKDLSVTHDTIMSMNSAEDAEKKLRDICSNGHDEEKKFNDRLSRIKSKLGKKRTTLLHKKPHGNGKA